MSRASDADVAMPAVGVGQVQLGRSGLMVSRLGLGMMSYGPSSSSSWALDEAEAEPIVRAAVELGITFFDTADSYGDGASELLTGRLLAKLTKREEVVVATKVFFATSERPNGSGLSRKHIFRAIDASLLRLGMDYVDLYQIHRFDPNTPLEETMEALNDVVRSGKALYLGASTMRAWQFAKAQSIAASNGWTRFVSMQDRYNLLYREEEREMIPLCVDQGVAVLPYSPLAGGALAGTRARDGEPRTRRAQSRPRSDPLYGREADLVIIDRLTEVAEARGETPAAVALAWVAAKSFVTAPIIGATSVTQLRSAVSAHELRLASTDLRALEELYRPRDWVG
jgi:aryl-alcohol dehydrogenase-like predicted oxidoreductase